jgi:hypothetical protein
VVSIPAEEHNIYIWHTSPLVPQVAPKHLTLHGQRCICHKNIFTSCGSGHKTFPGLYSSWVRSHDSSHDDVSLYRTIGTASSKPRLEATGPEFTSPGTRILTFLPWHRCVIAENKLQILNTESKSLLACHLSRLL